MASRTSKPRLPTIGQGSGMDLTDEEIDALVEERAAQLAKEQAPGLAEDILREREAEEAKVRRTKTIEQLVEDNKGLKEKLTFFSTAYAQLAASVKELEQGQLSKKAKSVVAAYSAGGGLSLAGGIEIARLIFGA